MRYVFPLSGNGKSGNPAPAGDENVLCRNRLQVLAEPEPGASGPDFREANKPRNRLYLFKWLYLRY